MVRTWSSWYEGQPVDSVATGEQPEQFYRRRISEEAESGEPELLLLPSLVRAGGTAVDIGANEGLYAYALSGIADAVHAFEAHPEYAAFAQRMLGPRVNVHAVALSNAPGRAPFFVPVADDGSELHLAGNLKNTHSQFSRQRVIEVQVRTLDSFGLRDVRFIKVDVEGSEREVLEGARATVSRDRPVLLLELLSGTYADPLSITREVCDTYGYSACIVHGRERLDALATIASLSSNTTWGTHISTRNVLFSPAS